MNTLGMLVAATWFTRSPYPLVPAPPAGAPALYSPGRGGRTDLLDGGQEQADEDGDDRDHHQQLDQREPAGTRAPSRHENTPRRERDESKETRTEHVSRKVERLILT